MSRLPNMTNRAEVPEGLLDAYDQVAGDRRGREFSAVGSTR